MAAWLAPPPIQAPAVVVMPRQMAFGPSGFSSDGSNAPMIASATGAPTMMPVVPVRNRMMALGPSRAIALRSQARVSSTSAIGSR